DGPGAYEPAAQLDGNTYGRQHRADATIDLSCLVFNFQDAPDNTVTLNNYVCPPGVNPEEDILLDVCSLGGDGIHFDFVDGNGVHPATVVDGRVEWSGVVIGAEGELQIIETIPAGFGDPIVVCDGMRMDSTNGFVIPQ